MKHLKTLGLVLVAVAALTAMVGAGTASATTTLCKKTITACTPADHYPVGTVVVAHLTEGTNANLKAGFATVSCEESTIEGTTKTTTTSTTENKLLSFGKCKDSLGRTCVVTTNKPGTLEVHYDVAHNGTLTASGFTFTFVCGTAPFATTCVYAGNVTEKITLTGGAPAVVHAEEAAIPLDPEAVSSGTCASPSKWTATYTVTTPNPLYVSFGV